MVKKELKLAYILAIVFLLVGVICYAVPGESPEQPLRFMFKSVAGRVLFDHQTHTGASGYGISCQDCHHHPEEDPDTRGCGSCHTTLAEGEMAPGACFDCHESEEIEDSETTKRADAFHAQCINCHKEYEAGPVECSGCHIL